MRQLIYMIVFVCVLSTSVIGASDNANQQPASTPPLPMQLTTIGHIRIILHDIQPADHRLVFEISSPDVTAMPSRSALRLAFDAEVTGVTEPSISMPLQLETAVTGQQVAFFLARDPFALPQPWSYTVSISFSRLPQTGGVTLGNLPIQNVTYPSPSPAVQPLPGT